MSDEDAKSENPTVPPPPGEDDAYSASTVVGQASAELLALIRTAEDAAVSKDGAETARGEDDADALLASARAASANAAAARKAAAGARASSPPSAEAAARVAPTGPPSKPFVVRTSDAPPVSTPAPAPSAAAVDGAPGLPPAAGIVLLFAAAAGVLAALVR
ncbi:MAG: hypothetical protein KF819_22805 [Labilithrix sp.]|nr:hypothetical protein [Labilithrix sp.]